MKFIIHADDREALAFAAECCFDLVEAEYKLCGFADRRFFASARKNKHSVSIAVMRKDTNHD